jgi:CRISPR-associated protein Csm1
MQKGNMQDLINKIGHYGDIAKQKKMQEALRESGHTLDRLYDNLLKYGECSYCGVLPANSEKDGEKICENCNELIEIGKKLVKAIKICFKPDKLSSFSNMVSIYTKNDRQFGEDKEFGYFSEYKAGFPFLPLPYFASRHENDNIKSFEELARLSLGNQKLAMFKADIDYLGLVFISSWGKEKENKISFSRYAQLSRNLNYFFSAFIYDFLEEQYNENTYTVFSGGDDICILGSWNAVMDFANDFCEKFSDFTNNNPSVTLSGGIALANPRLPVRAIADEAEEALKKSKNRKNKNGISVFNVTVSWDEYKKSLEDGKAIKKYLIDEKTVSSAMVYKIIDLANRAQKVNEGSMREHDRLWMSNFRYIITRNIDSEKNKEAFETFGKFGVCPKAMENSRIAVSYALYAQKK